jgi:hypothetical protein
MDVTAATNKTLTQERSRLLNRIQTKARQYRGGRMTYWLFRLDTMGLGYEIQAINIEIAIRSLAKSLRISI